VQRPSIPATKAVLKAVRNGELEQVMAFVTADGDVHGTINKGLDTLLILAARHGQCAVMELLLAVGADVEQSNKVLHRPLHEAALWAPTVAGGGDGKKVCRKPFPTTRTKSPRIVSQPFRSKCITVHSGFCYIFSSLCQWLLFSRSCFFEEVAEKVQELLIFTFKSF
jgi:hypothetical protein